MFSCWNYGKQYGYEKIFLTVDDLIYLKAITVPKKRAVIRSSTH